MIRILLADDSLTVRQKLQYMLDSEADFSIVGSADNGETVVELCGTLKPDVALVDIEMPGLNGLEATQQIAEQHPDTKVLIFSSYGDDAYISQALKAGARGYLLKDTPAAELFHAIRFVHKGYLQLGPGLFEKDSTQMQLQPEGDTPQGLTDQDEPMVQEGQIEQTLKSVPQASDPPIETMVLASARTALPVQAQPTDLMVLPQRDQTVSVEAFDRPVVLRQSPIWSRVILWLIVFVTGLIVAWACIFRIEEAVPAQGQLEPRGAVKDIQVPVGGVIEEVLVKDGDVVKKGQVLARIDPKSAQSDLLTNQKLRNNLTLINQYFKQELSGTVNADLESQIPASLKTTTKNRQALLQENKVLQAQLDNSIGLGGFSATEQSRILEARRRNSSSVEDSRFDVEQSQKSRGQALSRLLQIESEQQANLSRQERQKKLTASAKETLAFEKATFNDIEKAFEKGAIAGLQYKRQENQVQTAQRDFDVSQDDFDVLLKEFARLEEQKREISQEVARIDQEIQQGQNRSTITTSTGKSDLYDRIAVNTQRIDEIDSELTRLVKQNEQQIAEIDNRLNQARLTLQYQEVRAPVEGVVFDLQAGKNSVATTSEPIMKVVPTENLEAKLFLSNRDIGFIQNNFLVKQAKKEKLLVDIRIDSFPYSEYGDLQGVIEWIGSDALPPTETRPFPSFPVRVKLDSQRLKIRKSDLELGLQSGMSISASIKVRDRAIISLITERFTKQLENLKQLR